MAPITFFQPSIGCNFDEISALCLCDKFRISSASSSIFAIFENLNKEKICKNIQSSLILCFVGEINLSLSKRFFKKFFKGVDFYLQDILKKDTPLQHFESLVPGTEHIPGIVTTLANRKIKSL